ncbi:MAG TPA: hypothetical protein VIT45_12400 [Allosphingosinicella sp.]
MSEESENEVASEILEHPSVRARRSVETAPDEAAPPILQGEVQPAEEGLASPVLERLHALVRKGYRPEIGADTATDLVVLRHVGRAPDLVLHSDGTVEGFDGRRPLYKRNIDAPAPFAAGDLREQLRFMRFVDSIPRATLRDRTRRFRQRYVYFPLVVAILLAIHLAFTAIILDGDDSAPAPSTRAEQEAQVRAIQAEAAEAAAAAGAPALPAGKAEPTQQAAPSPTTPKSD